MKDDKILTDWNGLMIAALARGGSLLKAPVYLQAARKAAVFILGRQWDDQGRLLHRYRAGEAAIGATANDYAFLIWGLLELYRAEPDKSWLDRAVVLQQRMTGDFWDGAKGGFFLTGSDQRDLPVRPKEIYDGAMPSANAVALHNLIDFGRLTGDDQYLDLARHLIQAFGGSVRRQAPAFLHTLDGWVRYGQVMKV